MLFVQGSRDAFGTQEEIQALIANLKLPAELFAIEHGDHSFKVPKHAGATQPEVYSTIMDRVSEWVRRFS